MRLMSLIAVLFGLVVTMASCDRGADGKPAEKKENQFPRILLITLDTVRADHIGSYGYFRETMPVVDALAKESLVFDQAYAPMATTLPSHASLLTGYEPLEHGILANMEEGGNAFGTKSGTHSIVEFAKKAGYATGAFVSAAPLKKSGGLHAGFDMHDEPIGATRDGAETVELALRWLKARGPEPTLVWVHLYDPHFPYTPKAEYDAFSSESSDPLLDRWLNERQVQFEVQPSQCKGRVPTFARSAHNLYDGELRYTDHLVGRLLDHYRKGGWWDDALVIVVADHGEGLNQHGWPQHGRIWNEQLHIPLLMKFPKNAAVSPGRFDKLTAIVDVFPTACAQLKLAWAAPFLNSVSGRNVLSPRFRERPLLGVRSGRKCPDDVGAEFVLTTREWRFHLNSPSGNMLYNRREDPFELSNLVSAKPAVAEQAEREVKAMMELFAQRGKDLEMGQPRSVQKMDPKLRQELVDLGYAGGDEDDEQSGNQP